MPWRTSIMVRSILAWECLTWLSSMKADSGKIRGDATLAVYHQNLSSVEMHVRMQDNCSAKESTWEINQNNQNHSVVLIMETCS